MKKSYVVKQTAWLLFVIFFCVKAFAQPSINSFTPASGPVGTTVTITGSGFSTNASGNIVFFGAVQAAVTAASGTSLTVTVPAGATFKPITVTTNNLTAYSARPFIVTFPDGDPLFHAKSFASKVDWGTGTDALIMAIGDLDADGKPDLANVNRGANTVSIFRNTTIPGTLSLETRIDLATGAAPTNVSIGDIDGDGKPDLAVVNSGANTISVFKNTSTVGSISFASKTDFATGVSPQNIAIGDLDADGKPELAVANGGSAFVSIFKNQTASGSISFTRTDIASATNPDNISIGDVDNDGKPDLATVHVWANSIGVFKNLSSPGTITFGTRITYNTGYGPQELAIADLDGDGYPELTVAGNETINVFRNNGVAGTISLFATPKLVTAGSRSALGINDMDGDGKPDIVTAIGTINSVAVMKNTSTPGSLSYLPEVWYSSGFGPGSLCTGDMDGDGKPDLEILNFGISAGSVSILRNRANEPNTNAIRQHNGCAVAGSTVTVAGSNFTGATAVSFGGTAATSFTVVSDTIITAVVAAPVTNNVAVTTSYGTGTFNIPAPTISAFRPPTGTTGSTITITGTYFCGATAVTIGGAAAASFTVNSDTSISAVVGSMASGNITVTTPYGTGTLTGFNNGPAITSFTPLAGNAGAFVTIRGTGFNTTPSLNSVYFGPVKATVTAAIDTLLTVTVPVGATLQPITVTNNNLTAYSPQPFTPTFVGGITITNESFAAKTDFTTGTVPIGSAVGDFDNDGKADLAVVNNSVNTVSVYRNTGSRGIVALGSKVDYIAGASPYGVAVGDVNGDGMLDMAVINKVPGTVSIFKNTSTTGAISFEAKKDFYAGSIPTSIVLADFDTDGKPDVAAATDSSYMVVVIRNTSRKDTISFDEGYGAGYWIASGSYGLTAADVNGDGRPDIAAVNKDAASVSVLKNNSTPGVLDFGSHIDYATGQQPLSVAAGDVNADHKPDLAIANSNSGSVSILRNINADTSVSFAPKIDYPTGAQPYSICFSDLDGNGRPDLATANFNAASVSVLRNVSTGDSISISGNIDFTTGLQPYHVTTGDMDADGKPDLIVVNKQSNTVSVLRNKVGDAKVTPSGANPVTGNIIINVTIDPVVQNYNGNAYVQRHYDIEPVNDPATATATITLYFTQEEFDQFNASLQHGLDLPTGANDAAGKANLRVYQYHGFSTTSLPGSYTGGGVEIDPDDNNIVWNNVAQWWEVTFDVTGFSGFFVSSVGNTLPLPLQMLSFTGKSQKNVALLQWITSEEINTRLFELQRSVDGRTYTTITTIPAAGNSTGNRTYSYVDKLMAAPEYFYRLKVIDADGDYTYSTIVTITSAIIQSSITVYPNPARKFAIIGHPAIDRLAKLELVDMTGKLVKRINVTANTIQTRITLNGLPAGAYKLVYVNGDNKYTRTLLVQ